MAGDDFSDDYRTPPEVVTQNPFSGWWKRLLYHIGLGNKLILAGVLLPSLAVLLLLGLFYWAGSSWMQTEVKRTLTGSMSRLEQSRVTRLTRLRDSAAYLSRLLADSEARGTREQLPDRDLNSLIPPDTELLIVDAEGSLLRSSRNGESTAGLTRAIASAPAGELPGTSLLFGDGANQAYDAAIYQLPGGRRMALLHPFSFSLAEARTSIKLGYWLESAPDGTSFATGDGQADSVISAGQIPSESFSTPVFLSRNDYAVNSRRVKALSPSGPDSAVISLGIDLQNFRTDRLLLYAAALGGVGILVLGLLVAFGSTLTSHILHPLRFLMHRMELIRQHGALDLERISEQPADKELHALFETFNYMLLSLQVTQQQLSELNEHLNEKVEERTEELRELYQESEEANEQLRTVTRELETAYSRLQEYAADLRRAQRSQSEFFAKISHELRTPLNAIIGFSQLLKNNAAESLSDQQQSDLETIYNNGKHLLEMVNELLDYSKIEAGKMEFDKRMRAIRPVLENACEIVHALAAEKGLSLEKEFEEELPEIYMDEVRIRQAIINLLSNAIKYTEKGYVRLEAFRDDEHVVIRVIDSGVGISEEQQEEIFQEFTQLETGSDSQSGTGLGLPITKYFIEEHGGRIQVESELGEGSTFTIHLPTLSPPQAEADEDVEERELAPEQVLDEVEPGAQPPEPAANLETDELDTEDLETRLSDD